MHRPHATNVALLLFPVVRVMLAMIPAVDLCFPFFFLTSPVLLLSPPIVSTPLYPSSSFSIPLPLPLNLSSRSPLISVSVFLFSFYPPLQAHPLSSSIVPILSTCPAHLSRLLTNFLMRLSLTNFLMRLSFTPTSS